MLHGNAVSALLRKKIESSSAARTFVLLCNLLWQLEVMLMLDKIGHEQHHQGLAW